MQGYVVEADDGRGEFSIVYDGSHNPSVFECEIKLLPNTEYNLKGYGVNEGSKGIYSGVLICLYLTQWEHQESQVPPVTI